MRLNDLLEEDLRTLKETDFMGPTTRAEYNRRKKVAADASGKKGGVTREGRKMMKQIKADPSAVMERIKQQPKAEQLKIMRAVFGG